MKNLLATTLLMLCMIPCTATAGEDNDDWMSPDRLRLDLYSGFNLQHPKDGMFVGAGVAWRIR